MTETASSPTAPVGATEILLGLNTFGDAGVDADGNPKPHAQVLRELLAEAELADAVGLHAFGVGEHHRRDFAVSAPEVFLAAAAARTSQIRLGSAVTVLSSDDPIRVFQRFSTVDALSNGRAEVMLGRGSFVESFPLFGLDLADYEVLFEEKLELFDKVRAQKPVHWEGRTRPNVNGMSVFRRWNTTCCRHGSVWAVRLSRCCAAPNTATRSFSPSSVGNRIALPRL